MPRIPWPPPLPGCERLERGEPGGRLDRGGASVKRVFLAQHADELVDLADRLPGDVLDRLERGTDGLGVSFLEEPGGAGLDQDHVDRVAGGVVQVACDS